MQNEGAGRKPLSTFCILHSEVCVFPVRL
jgi:hypothetical protein